MIFKYWQIICITVEIKCFTPKTKKILALTDLFSFLTKNLFYPPLITFIYGTCLNSSLHKRHPSKPLNSRTATSGQDRSAVEVHQGRGLQ